jgi:hypothetical protein
VAPIASAAALSRLVCAWPAVDSMTAIPAMAVQCIRIVASPLELFFGSGRAAGHAGQLERSAIGPTAAAGVERRRAPYCTRMVFASHPLRTATGAGRCCGNQRQTFT